jgi:hypothetical protein
MGSRVRGQVKPVKSAIGAPHAIVVWQVDIQANPTSGVITNMSRAISFSVEASTHIDGVVLGATASRDRTPDPPQMKRIAMST